MLINILDVKVLEADDLAIMHFNKKLEIIEANACKDRIHMLVSIPPKLSVAQFMGYLKGNKVYILRNFDYINRPKELLTPEIVQMLVSIHEHKGKQELFIKANKDELNTLKAYREFENRVDYMRDRKLSKPERIQLVIDNKVGKISKKDIMKRCPDISKITIERTLNNLLVNGYIEKVGSGRSTAYIKK